MVIASEERELSYAGYFTIMIDFVTWPAFCLSLLSTKRWLSDKANHNGVYDQIP